jgi:hypothetical protein
MAAKKLTDPILNDLSGLVTGRLKAGFNHSAQTRYLTHLERLDNELTAARAGTGRTPIGVNEELVQISNQRLEGMRSDLERLAFTLANVQAAAAASGQTVAEMHRLETALFDEFGPALAQVDGRTAVDIALGLLRLWRPDAEKTGVAATTAAEAPHDTDHTTGPDDPAGHAARAAAPDAGAGPGQRGARTRRAS